VVWFILFLLSIVVANWTVATFGIVPVGFGFEGPAAVYIVGLTFTFRDLLHESLGKRYVLIAILGGAAISYIVSPQFALASGAAFLLSESLDFAIYSPLRERSFLGAVAASNTVGLTLDSVVFLWLAFGSLEYLPGQIIGKAWMTLLAVLVLWGVRGVVLNRKLTR
jgi:uncharacterized PurR-regulated membrane protein YhhQ (DUF165 family)